MKKRIIAWCLIGALSIGNLPVYAEESVEVSAETVQTEATSVESDTETKETVVQSIESTEAYSEEQTTVEETVEKDNVEEQVEEIIEENIVNEASATVVDSGTCGEHLTWVLDDTGTLTISGYGEMANYDDHDYTKEIPDVPWKIYRAQISRLKIAHGVTTIGDYAFPLCRNLGGNLIIPDSVTSIGESAFYKCSGFTGELHIPNSVTSIGPSAFDGCKGFTGELHIPDSVRFIGSYAFRWCSSFTGELHIPNGVTSIERGAFYGCSGFTGELHIPNSVTCIEGLVFMDCSGFTGELHIPNSVTRIEIEAFHGCSGFTGELYIPESVTSIGSSAFHGCSGFTGELHIPNSVTWMGDHAFYGCSGFTGELHIPESVTSIPYNAFYGCSGFTGELHIPNGVTSIEWGAFYGCSGFTGELHIPNSVTCIEDEAFRGCTKIKKIYFVGSAPSIGSNAFRELVAIAYYPGGDASWTSDVMGNYGGTLTWKPWNPDAQGTIPVTNDYIIERVRAYTSGQMSDRLNALLGSDLPFELRFQKINELFCNYGMLDAKEGIAFLGDSLDEHRAFEAMTTNEIYTACDFTTWIRSNDAKAIATRAGLYSSALLLNGEYKDYLKPSTYLQDATPEVKKYKSMFYDFMQAGGDKVAYETALEGAQQLLYLLKEKQEVSTEVFNAYMSKFSFSKTVGQVDSYINELLAKIDKNTKIDFEVPSDSTFGKIIGGTGEFITIASMGIEDYKLYSKISSTAEVYGQYEEFLYDIAYGENDLPSCMKAAAAQVMNECENQIEAVTTNIAGQITDYCKDKAEGVVFEAAGLGIVSEATSVIDFAAFVSNTLISMNQVVEKEACIEAYAVLSDYYAAKLIQDKSNFLADASEENAWTFYKDYNLLYQLREEGEKAYLAMCEPTLENGILVFILGNGKGYQEKADVVKQNLDYLKQHCQFDLPDAVEEQLGRLYKQKVMASCPVDMAVYNPNGDLICTIKDGAESDVVNEYGRFVCTYRAATGDYVKIAYLNSADNYKVKLTGTDTGVVSVSYAKVDETGGSIVYSTDYDTIIPKASMEFNTYELPGKVNVDSDADGKSDTSIEMKEDGQLDIRVTGIEVEKEAVTLEIGQTMAVGVDVLPANAAYKDVEWTVADSNVAVVTNGKIEAKAPGKTIVTVKTLDGGYEAHISVTVAEEKQPEEYVVTYNANGGKSEPLSQKKIQGEALKLTNSKPTKAYALTYNANGGNVSNKTKAVSCTFKNWNTKADGSGTSYASGSSYTQDMSVILYAQWTDPEAGTLATPTRSGYTFDGWYTSANGGSKVTSGTTISKDMTLYAHWNKKAVSEPQYKDDVEAFVAQLYKVCLSRNPDAGGLNTWTTRLKNKQETGVSAAYGFVFSNEFKAKNLCNEDYVEQLYAAFMGRKADVSGKATWINLLESGTTREEVFNGFALSKEFADLCSKYGIEQGKGIEIPKFGTIPTGACAICGEEDGVTGFVTRLYQVCLNRKPDAGGLKDWRTRLCEHTSSGREVAYGFIFSQEFIGKKYTNSDYVEHLYEAFMGRSSDAAGKKMWVDLLNTGWSREKVFDGFVGSDEFTKICNSYGIVRD